MVNIKIPTNPVQKRGQWPPKNFRTLHYATDTDDWSSIAKRYQIDVRDLILFNFDTEIPEEINWYLRELIGCKFTGPDGHNYSFRGADKGKRHIYIPKGSVQPAPKPPEKATDDEYIEDLRKKIEASDDRRKARCLCMISKVQQGGDDRVILWQEIVPEDGTGFPSWGGKSRNRLHSHHWVEPQWLQKNIKTWADVDVLVPNAGMSVSNPFVTSLKKYILSGRRFGIEPIPSGLLFLHDDIANSPKQLDRWANLALGGGSIMPQEYRAIHEWLKRILGDKNSVLNCLMTTTGK